jgi:exoribonuclease R
MRAGDLVEFKPGSHGIGAPQNYGIYLDRVRRKGEFYVVLWTVKGKLEMRRESLTSRQLSARIDGELDEATLKSRLTQLLKDMQKGKVKEEQRFQGEVTDKDIWRSVTGTTDAVSAEHLASLHFGQGASRSQVDAVKKALEKCREGVGYFRRAPGKEERWVPIGVEAYKAAKREVEQFYALRKKLVKEELVEEEGWDEPRRVYRGVPLADAGLTDEDRARLAQAHRVMASFVLHDRDLGVETLGSSGIHTIDGFGMFDWARWVASDWLGGAVAGISSTFVEFLVDAGLWTERAALETVAQRKVLANPDFAWETPEQVEKEAARFTQDSVAAALPGRWDLREGHVCYTIDPPDAKDYDDAVGIDFHADGGATLWVHIADVSHYVEKGMHLDDHARRRATSVYLPVRVLPMLPHALSDDLCSLRAQRDRLAMTCKLTYDARGALVQEAFGESVIRVRENKHYGQVDEAVRRGEEPFAAMEAFARKLGAQRKGLALETGERKILFGADGMVDPTLKSATPATRMIEVFMVAANEAVARFITAAGHALPYRCHPLPDRASVERFNAQMATMESPLRLTLPEPDLGPGESSEVGGISMLEMLQKGGKLELLSGGFKPEAEEPPAEGAEPLPPPMLKGLAQLSAEEREAWLQPFRDTLAQVVALASEEERDLVQLKLLGCMGRAFYTPRNIGHFGLGSTCYSHFTSPIRRYPDLVTHRLLRWLLRSRPGDRPHTDEDLEDLSVHCSDQGSDAERLERGVVDAAMVFASRAMPTGNMRGLVNGITKGGVFLSFPGGLEGKLLTSDIPGGPYAVDEYDSMLFQGELERPVQEKELEGLGWKQLVGADGEVIRVRVRLGDWLRVVVVGRDYVDGRVRVKLTGHLDLQQGVRL